MKKVVNLCLLLVLGFCFLFADLGPAQDRTTNQVPRGKTTLLRESPKVFARFLGAGSELNEFRLLVEGETEPKTLTLDPAVEIKFTGCWGRLDQLVAGDRIWVWSQLNRNRKPIRVIMLADEISEQDIHNLPYQLKSVDVEKRVVRIERVVGRRKKLESRELPMHDLLKVKSVDDHFEFFNSAENSVKSTKLKPGDKVFVQTANRKLRLIWNEQQLESARIAQIKQLRQIWIQEGLPGTVSFSHPLVGEAELMLDHEAMRWGRYLKPGDKVKVATKTPIDAVVHDVKSWHDKTRVTISAVTGRDLSDLTSGQRIHLLVPEPPAEIQASSLPTDLGRTRGREQRVQWFLANTYCSCSIDGDGCTGMFYTLASCNPGTCGMPKRFRGIVETLIDQGKKDEEILSELTKTLGPMCTKQHLLK